MCLLAWIGKVSFLFFDQDFKNLRTGPVEMVRQLIVSTIAFTITSPSKWMESHLNSKTKSMARRAAQSFHKTRVLGWNANIARTQDMTVLVSSNTNGACIRGWYSNILVNFYSVQRWWGPTVGKGRGNRFTETSISRLGHDRFYFIKGQRDLLG